MIYIMRLYLSKKQCLCSLEKRFFAILDCLCKDFSIPKFTFLLVDQVSSRGRFKFKISGLPWKLLLSTFNNLLHTWVGPELKVKPLELPIFSLNDYMFLSNAVLFLNETVHILHLLQHLIFVGYLITKMIFSCSCSCSSLHCGWRLIFIWCSWWDCSSVFCNLSWCWCCRRGAKLYFVV